MDITIALQTSEAALDADWKSTPDGQIERKSVEPLKVAGKGRANFVDPVTAVLVLSGTTLAFRLFEYFKKKNERGIQIDLRKTPAEVTTLENVPNGFVVIIDKDGKARTEQAKYDKPEQLDQVLQKLLAGGGG